MSLGAWKKCSSCKSEIRFQTIYWTCSVSTCNRKRTALQFCSVGCWDAHLPIVRHRESWAEEHLSPTEALWRKVLAGEIDWPTREKKESVKVAEVSKRPEGVKVIRRRPGGGK